MRIGARELLSEDDHLLDREEGQVEVNAGLVELTELVFLGAVEDGFDGSVSLQRLCWRGLAGTFWVVAVVRLSGQFCG